jgi:internalin A
MRASGRKRQIFICYSRKDGSWLKEIRDFLGPLESDYEIIIFDDTKIRPGSKWFDEILGALATSSIALLLVSQNFLTSEFIRSVELPRLLQAAESDGLVILSLHIHLSTVSLFGPLTEFQAVNQPDRPLSTLRPHQRREVLVGLVETILDTLQRPMRPNGP